ncbi:magnesium transporter MgtE N-terminal domain-containing protein [Thiohalorhabdus methylotrophus]|uniref:Magnesium transporter MgtE N-terminal domain-containing protein n=1 Tax=Thiohalorhabdus methylotrophus TaxID=3242694 RepID=A0ABV4TSA3_9GAMM
MAEETALARIFLESHPAEAAGVLEGLPPGEVAELAEELPAAVLAPAVGAMTPVPGARCLREIGEERAAELLQVLPARRAAALIRGLPWHRQRSLVARIRPGRRTTLATLLHQPGDTVGAWVDPEVLTVREDVAVGQALHRVQESDHKGPCGIYVVDGDSRLLGVARLPKLMQAGRETPVGRVAERGVPVLASATGLAALPGHPAWKELAELPVVDSQGRLMGAVTAATLSLAIQDRSETAQGPRGSVLGAVSLSFFQTLGVLVQILVSGSDHGGRGRTNGR